MDNARNVRCTEGHRWAASRDRRLRCVPAVSTPAAALMVLVQMYA